MHGSFEVLFIVIILYLRTYWCYCFFVVLLVAQLLLNDDIRPLVAPCLIHKDEDEGEASQQVQSGGGLWHNFMRCVVDELCRDRNEGFHSLLQEVMLYAE